MKKKVVTVAKPIVFQAKPVLVVKTRIRVTRRVTVRVKPR